ncbi:MAG: family 10 glycosylhydrolase [Clostridia bacterium]|nr:family 10 glycosylhydrolase [Clostridia bacterium]
MKDRASILRYLMVGGFILLFLALLGGGLYLMTNKMMGTGPDRMEAATPDEEIIRTGALMDPGREVRGLWIPSVLNITFPSKAGLSAEEMRAELDDIVKTARDANLNTLCLQVRPSSDALYDSDLFPTSAYLSGKQGKAADDDFDPLAYLCEIAADETQGEALAVFAWVNPLRVTSAGQKVSALSRDNPAVVHPEWTFTYNNAVYYNAAIPEVRELIAAGVAEICRKYPVAGVIFDDYFYPYPANDANGVLMQVPDQAEYAKYGTAFDNVGDFRRDNVNQMVKACYDAIKDVSEYLQFGIAPFGIWQNDNGRNGGSDTAGMEAYSAIYCDPIAWMEGGYIDFLAPQIYWQFTTKVARYDTLVRFWNAKCDEYDTPMWISHALHNYATWNNPGEMRNQIGFARAELSYRGSLFYGYPQLRDNTLGVTDEIRASFAEEIVYFDKEQVTDIPADITVTVPYNNFRYDEAGTYLLGQSNPAGVLYCNGQVVSRTKSGYFSFYTPLSDGANTFVFTQNGEEYVHTVWKNASPPKAEAPEATEDAVTETVETLAPEPILTDASPASLTAVSFRDGLHVSVRANADAAVTARLGDTALVLSAGKMREDGTAVFEGVLSLGSPDVGAVLSLGTLSFDAVWGEHALHIDGGEVYSMGDGAVIGVTVTRDSTQMKISPTSWYYDDYIPTSAGMTVSAYEISGGYAKVMLAGNTAYLDASGIAVTEAVGGLAMFGEMTTELRGEEICLVIPSSQNVPVNCVKADNTFRVTLYRGYTDANTAKLSDNPILSSVSFVNGGEDEGAYTVYTFGLHARDNFYGFRVLYEDGRIVIALRGPMAADLNAAQPLAGRTVILDAGHGGTDTGTLTPGTHRALNEKDCNLQIVLALAPKLEALGAEVILLREDDSTVDIYDRMDAVDAIAPDLLLSIHQNSMPQNSDISHIRGVVGLYWTESGRSLADCVAEEIAIALGRLKRDTTGQRLAMLRNYKFPSALIEIGFVTSAEEFETLTAPGGVELTAQAIADGVLKWFETQQMGN